jgi:hypothetical protein
MWESPSHRLLSAGRQRGRQQLASRFIEATALLCAISWFVVSLYGALNAGSSAPLNRRELRGTAPLDSVSPSEGFLPSSDVTPSPVPTVRPAVNARRAARRVEVPEEGRHTGTLPRESPPAECRGLHWMACAIYTRCTNRQGVAGVCHRKGYRSLTRCRYVCPRSVLGVESVQY